VKQWVVSFAVFAAIATVPMPANAQRIIQIPSGAAPRDEAPPPGERAVQDQEPPTDSGCRISTVEEETPLGKRTITRTVCQ
jgi:hypothetical protein